MTSIRAAITKHLLVGFIGLFSVCGVGLYVFIHHALVRQFDDALRGRANAFVAMTEREHQSAQGADGKAQEPAEGTVEFDFVDKGVPEFDVSPDSLYYQVWDKEAQVLARSPSAEGRDLPHFQDFPGLLHFGNIALPDGRAGRAIYMRFAPRSEGKDMAAPSSATQMGLLLAMARSREALDQTLRALMFGFAATAGVLGLGAAGIVRASTIRGLRPLEAISDEAARIGADSLHHRFDAEGMPTELTPISARLNDLLTRLEQAFQRERRFTANAAHELRTPIAELRALAEDGLRSGSASGSLEFEQHFRDALDIAVQVEHLLGVLLALARAQVGGITERLDAFDLNQTMETARGALLDEANSKCLRFDLALAEEASVRADSAFVQSIIDNLMSNAIRYSPEGGCIRVATSADDVGIALAIANAAPELGAEDLAHFFEPFWRKDKARTDHSRLGIGLTLARTYAELMGGELDAVLSGDGWIELRLWLRRAGSEN